MNNERAVPVYGSDLIVDLLDELGIEHVSFNPGASFRGIHDSLVNHGGPDIHLCLHEEVAVAFAHGYAKAAGRPMAVLLHDVVGLQHATMAIYNAWCDRVPILLVGGTGPMSVPERRPWIDWIHTALVQGNQVRDYVKWDDQPSDLASVTESLIRAHRTATAAPTGPVYVCLDVALQEQKLDGDAALPAVDGYPRPQDPAPSARDIEWLAQGCVEADLPVLVTDYAGDTEEGFELLVELAEMLHAPVIDLGRRLNFPTGHELDFRDLHDILDEADLVICVDVEDPFGALLDHVYLQEGGQLRRRPGVTVVHLTPGHLKQRSWAKDHQRLVPLDRLITTTAVPALTALIPACRDLGPSGAATKRRRDIVGDRVADARRSWRSEAGSADADDRVPPSRLAAGLWELLADEDWVLVNGSLEGWELRLWEFARPRQHLGWHGGGGLGYGPGAAVGAALALREGPLCVSLQPDGDLLFAPAALWTAAHDGIPLLFVTHNNRQYRNTVDHAARIAQIRGRDRGNRYVGAAIDDPPVDLATLAGSFGVWSTGPVTDAAAVVPAVAEALEVVRSGRPALVDVITTGS